MRPSGKFEAAVFSDAKKADYRARWILLLFTLLFLAVVYWVARDIVYQRLVHGYAQRMFNNLGSAAVEKIGSVSIDRQGDVTLHDAEAYTHRRGERRLFFRARKLRLTLDGMPLRDDDLRVMRVDLFQPEIFIRREVDGEWNIAWAFIKAPRGPEDPPPPPIKDDPWKDYLRPDESFPRNGLHIHDGTIHVTFAARSGKEVTWRITAVRAVMARIDGMLTLLPFTGNFYGGRITARAEVPRVDPFTARALTVDVTDADVARMAEGAPFIKRRVSGKFNGVLSLTVDREKTKQQPIVAGHCEITEGDLWEVPVFSGIIHLLSLTSVEDRRIDTAVLTFTVEEEQIRVDRMHFLGYPVSLFGDGVCSLTGDWMEIVFVPRLGKSDWNSILPIIGAPMDLLAAVFKGSLMPVVMKGSFDSPQIAVEPLYFLKPSVRQLMEEKAPR